MNEFNLANIPLVNFIWEDYSSHKESYVNQINKDYKQNCIESNVAPRAKQKLWESKFNYLELPVFLDLKNWIIQTCQEYINQKNKKFYNFVITESWAHKTEVNGYHTPHYHPDSTWSGIFYLTTNTSGANNWYLPYYIEPKPGLDYFADKFTIHPLEGNLILFPSCILHDAAPLENNDDRIVISFNANCI